MLEIKNLTKLYPGNVKAVDNLSLTVEDGDLYGFIGHNGSESAFFVSHHPHADPFFKAVRAGRGKLACRHCVLSACTGCLLLQCETGRAVLCLCHTGFFLPAFYSGLPFHFNRISFEYHHQRETCQEYNKRPPHTRAHFRHFLWNSESAVRF